MLNLSQVLAGELGRRYGCPQDLANALVFLASDKASHINGVHIPIAGGKFCVQNPGFSYGE